LGGSGGSVPAAESSSQGDVGDSGEKQEESKAAKMGENKKPKAAPKQTLNIFKKTTKKSNSDEEGKEAQAEQ